MNMDERLYTFCLQYILVIVLETWVSSRTYNVYENHTLFWRSIIKILLQLIFICLLLISFFLQQLHYFKTI